MKITAKGQVTIPLKIRKRLGLQPATEVEFDVVGNTARIKKVRDHGGRGQALVAHLKGKGSVRLNTEEIIALTRG